MADDGRQSPDPTAPKPDAGDDDATRVRPAIDPRMPPDTRPDATRVHPDLARAAYDDATRTVPPVGADRWAGSASVQPGRYEPEGYGYADDEPPPEHQPNWMRPVLFGFIGLLLLGAMLTGLWLIFTADDEPPANQDASAPPATSAAPATSTRPTPTPTSEPPTSEAPVTVQVPIDLVGLSEDEARQRITDAGLRVQVTRRPDATMAPGTVLEAVPGPGTEVPPNSLVRIVVAVEPPPQQPEPSGSSNG